MRTLPLTLVRSTLLLCLLLPTGSGSAARARAPAPAPTNSTATKRGLSGLQGCSDAKALGLANSWEYNWGLWPTQPDSDGDTTPLGSQPCEAPRTAEFVPMFWGCGGNCTGSLWPSFRRDWASIGVTAILGFNEPDNKGQSNLTPEQAARYWHQLDDLAQSFDPPLTLVGPGMTHWGKDGGSPWLDQFFGNLSGARAARITFLAQHDYSGDAHGIVARANAAFQKYGRKVWLTEFSVGNSAGRPANDRFAHDVLPLLDGLPSIARYAWFSARNKPDPTGWVNASNLLTPFSAACQWTKQSHRACAQMSWLSQHGGAAECKALALGNSTRCPAPVTVAWQSANPKGCYCANTTSCAPIKSTWQDLYVHRGGPPAKWSKTPGAACAAAEMLWLSQRQPLALCQAKALGTQGCTADKTVKVMYEGGDVKNCYCASALPIPIPTRQNQHTFRVPAPATATQSRGAPPPARCG